MSYNRAQTRSILISAVDQFLDAVEEHCSENDEIEEFDIMAHGIVAEIDWCNAESSGNIVDFWFSNENRIFQRGFFSLILEET